MSAAERLYRHLPIALQDLACSAEGLRIARTRYNRAFWRCLEEALAFDALSQDAKIQLRDRRLRHFVEHCAKTVPYYRRMFRERGIDHRDIETLEDLRAVPILDRATVKASHHEFVSDAVPKRLHRSASTSGSTGSGLVFPRTSEAIHRQYAVWWRYWMRHGIRFGTPCAYFGGRMVVPSEQDSPPYWRQNRPLRQTLFSVYHMSEKSLGTYVDELRRTNVPWIHGYPSAVACLAEYMNTQGVDLGCQIEFVTLASENTHPWQQSAITRAFGIQPLTHYGMAEAVANFSQRPDGYLYVDEDFAATEFVPLNGMEGHRVIGTNFSNPAFPLLRYDVGDIASLDDDPGSAGGRDGERRVAKIDGRAEDYVVVADGRKIGRVGAILDKVMNVREAQIVQRAPGEVTLRIVPAPGYRDEDEAAIRREATRRLGRDTAFSVERATAIPKTKSGKVRFVVSEIESSKNA